MNFELLIDISFLAVLIILTINILYVILSDRRKVRMAVENNLMPTQ